VAAGGLGVPVLARPFWQLARSDADRDHDRRGVGLQKDSPPLRLIASFCHESDSLQLKRTVGGAQPRKSAEVRIPGNEADYF
jgi:hypothetical protein